MTSIFVVYIMDERWIFFFYFQCSLETKSGKKKSCRVSTLEKLYKNEVNSSHSHMASPLEAQPRTNHPTHTFQTCSCTRPYRQTHQRKHTSNMCLLFFTSTSKQRNISFFSSESEEECVHGGPEDARADAAHTWKRQEARGNA